MAYNQVLVQSLAALNNPLSGQAFQSGGRQGEGLVSEIHGKYYSACYNGNVFTTLPASATIPVVGATLASKWCLVNPAGSGKNLELIRADFVVNSGTEVIGGVGLAKASVTTAGLSSLTAGTIQNGNLLAGLASVSTFYTAATHTDTPVLAKTLFQVQATANGSFVQSYMFDGAIIIPPGTVIDAIALVAAQTNAYFDLTWAEWPV